MAWQRTPETPSPDALVAAYHIDAKKLVDCSICHR
jgi:hypothetical protein